VSHKRTCHFVFDNNSGVSWSIFILFVPVETGRIALQITYLMVWWHHNCITSHVTKVCFIQLLLQVKYVEFEDRPNFLSKPVGVWKFFSQNQIKSNIFEDWLKDWSEDWLNNFLSTIRKEKHWTTFFISCKQLVRSNALRWLTSKCDVYMSF